ncbi:hypothetical protein IMCC3088_653 [Aequoribacter fuscus]|uniref:Uncharacterized protein n=1 Tax=Aequoribacter fuscus TaxID=2518989 RepID=F3L616_9GAMM|nr:hypothetical protein IMCC3088_653 [Aequoribacter fuscus]
MAPDYAYRTFSNIVARSYDSGGLLALTHRTSDLWRVG